MYCGQRKGSVRSGLPASVVTLEVDMCLSINHLINQLINQIIPRYRSFDRLHMHVLDDGRHVLLVGHARDAGRCVQICRRCGALALDESAGEWTTGDRCL